MPGKWRFQNIQLLDKTLKSHGEDLMHCFLVGARQHPLAAPCVFPGIHPYSITYIVLLSRIAQIPPTCESRYGYKVDKI